MAASGRSFVIAGAGMSGLTLALTLAKFGAKVVILERSDSIQEAGAGLQISPNARRILDQLGIAEALKQTAMEPAALDTYRHGESRPFYSMEFGPIMEEHFGAPYAVMHRGDLADALHKAARRFANIDIRFGVRKWSVSTSVRGLSVEVVEASGQTLTLRPAAFIGADGVHSQTRTEILGGPQAASGNRIAWRALIPTDAARGQIAMDRVSVFFGTGHHMVCYPLPHRDQVNLALFLPGSADSTATRPNIKANGPLASLLASAGDSWTRWALYTVETPTWHKGSVGIIGDAAHGMLPFQAQGAAMGIEDAATLGPLLVETDEPEAAFARYSAARQERVGKVASLSASNGRIFHMRWPMSAARDTVMRMQGPRAHLKRLGWIYGHEIVPGSVGQ
jgi:salicylate hydroxylase